MAWEATISTKVFVDGLLKVEVIYTDGIQTINDKYETRNPTNTWLRDNVRRRIKELKNIELYYDSINTGVYDPGEDVIVKTDEEKYLDKLAKFRSLQRMVDIGVIPNTDTAYLNNKTYLINNYNINYIK
jgi:hypothetical protein